MAASVKRPDGMLVFNPSKTLPSQIKSAQNKVLDYFDGVDSLISDGASIKKAVGSAEALAPPFKRLIAASRLSGFGEAAKYSGKKMPLLYGSKVQGIAEKRAAKVSRLMRKTTRRLLKTDSDFAISPERAKRAADYEARRSFFKGVKDAFAGVPGWGKEWMLDPAHPEDDDCDDAADEGVLPMDAEFSNGFEAPPSHLNCMCALGIHKI